MTQNSPYKPLANPLPTPNFSELRVHRNRPRAAPLPPRLPGHRQTRPADLPRADRADPVQGAVRGHHRATHDQLLHTGL